MLTLLLLLRTFIECTIAQGPQVCYAGSGSVYCLHTFLSFIGAVCKYVYLLSTDIEFAVVFLLAKNTSEKSTDFR